MAFSDENQPHFKHFCKICKKGFMCGRALGGHMRAHGVDDEIWNIDDEDPSNDLESSLAWSQESDADDDDEDTGCGSNLGVGSGWSKRKRSSRVCLSENEEDIALANCLMDLSNSRVDRPMDIQLVDQGVGLNREDQRRKPLFSPVFLSSFTKPTQPLDKAKGVALTTTTTPKGMFECKACKKVFNSHQALGGHRASHKNVKGCYASRNDQFDDNLVDDDVIIHDDYKPINTSYQSGHGPSTGPVPLAGRKSKVHKCSICNRIFASGQALGGHKRCHWLTSNYTQDTSTPKFNLHEHIEQLHQRALAIPRGLELNLTLPTSSGHDTTKTQPPTRLELSTEINLHPWSTPYQEKVDTNTNTNENNKHQSNNKNDNQDNHIGTSTTSMDNVDGEDESKAKLAKLSELKDMNNTNGTWLQVGIGSTTNIEPDL